MFAKVIFGAVLVAAVSARYIDTNIDDRVYGIDFPYRYVSIPETPYVVVEEIPIDERAIRDLYSHSRARRQVQGSVTLNSDGSSGLSAKVPIAGNDKNVLSAVGTMDFNDQMKTSSRGLGLALDNVNGHGLTVMKESVPGFGDRLSGAGKLNVFHNDNHDVAARAFITKNMPNIPQVPNFNTVGGGLDYTYKNKVGASLNMASTPFLQRKDYSATGNLNIFRSPTSSVDFNGGFKKFDTPFMRSSWEPHFGFTFGRSF